MGIYEILEIENRERNDISVHPRPREDCHGNNDSFACLSAPPLTIPFLAHFPATLSRFHSFLLPTHPSTCQEIKVLRPISESTPD